MDLEKLIAHHAPTSKATAIATRRRQTQVADRAEQIATAAQRRHRREAQARFDQALPRLGDDVR